MSPIDIAALVSGLGSAALGVWIFVEGRRSLARARAVTFESALGDLGGTLRRIAADRRAELAREAAAARPGGSDAQP